MARPKRKVAAVIRAATGDDVYVGEGELRHAARHFLLPRDLLLQLVTRVLQHPTVVYVDDRRRPREYRLFYRLEDGRYLLVVVWGETYGTSAFHPPAPPTPSPRQAAALQSFACMPGSSLRVAQAGGFTGPRACAIHWPP